MEQAIGYLAAFLTTAAFLPQAIKVWKLKETRDISLVTFAAFTAGVSMWLVYGLLIKDMPISVANGITLIFAASILVFKLRYG